MYIVKTPLFAQWLFKKLVWRIANTKKVFLTFDDGPIPEATPWVLDLLKENNIKSTFFCVGENVVKYPDIYQRILDEGHAIGNHTHNHLNAWKIGQSEYLSNVEKASEVIDSKLFRPPYGKLSRGLFKKLKEDYDVIMWDVLSGDFDSNISAEKCLTNVTKHSKEGSIIVFHDSIKAIEKLKYVLPKVISYFQERNISMERLEYENQ